MRRLVLGLMVPVVLGGCATGYLADRFGDRPQILSAQLSRFGLSAEDSRCVGDRLGRRLSFAQLRRLATQAGSVQQGLADPARLTMNDLIIAANGLGDREIRGELDSSARACGMAAATLTVASAAPASAVAVQSQPGGPADPLPPGVTGALTGPGGARIMTGAEAEAIFSGARGGAINARPAPAAVAAPAPVWLNLGAAGSGQAISIDGSDVAREGNARTAWFRMIEPGVGPSPTSFRLKVDCTARTIEPVARRRLDAGGAQVEHEIYAPGYEPPAPIENGTVTEIAYLSLCT